MSLVLTLREQPPQRCELSVLTPDRLARAEVPVERLEIQGTKRRLYVGDIFDVRHGDPTEIRIEGGSDRFDNLGRGMSQGTISLLGDAGQHAGHSMQGGRLTISGCVGHFAGCAMRGGRIEIGGDVGDHAGAPLSGDVSGMRAGVIRIKGSAGSRCGDRMRRGLIVVEGTAGNHLASRMIGGTIVCFGAAGRLPGYLMQRGTAIVGGGTPHLGPTFVDTGVHELVAMRLIARWLIKEGVEGGSLLASRLRRFAGDTAVLGKGELFLAET